MLDIDGLSRDVFTQAMENGLIPNIARLFGGKELEKGISFAAVANAPSITYSCQASTVTGAHPNQHHIPGNMFLDRFGKNNFGKPRYYQFDFIDAPLVFSLGLSNQVLAVETPTIFETAANYGLTSTVAYHMYARGAQNWLQPGMDDWALFANINQPNFGELYDDNMLHDVLSHLAEGHRPTVLLMYFFGMDHESHIHGTGIQKDYLCKVLDRQIGEFLASYEAMGLFENTLFCIFSDHGQIDIQNDDLHMLKVGSFFDREYSYLFQALNLDVNDFLLEGTNCDAILAQAGGMAQVYQRKMNGRWSDPPRFEQVLRLANAFWQSNLTGEFRPELKDALELILVRDVEREGWYADYQVFTPEGLFPLAAYLENHAELEWVDGANRIHDMASPVTGDILLFANVAQGYSFTMLPYKGMHGGLHSQDSNAVLAYGYPGGSPDQASNLKDFLSNAIQERCKVENNRHVSNVDVAFGIRKIMGW